MQRRIYTLASTLSLASLLLHPPCCTNVVQFERQSVFFMRMVQVVQQKGPTPSNPSISAAMLYLVQFNGPRTQYHQFGIKRSEAYVVHKHCVTVTLTGSKMQFRILFRTMLAVCLQDFDMTGK
jgi:hypothetical protein